MSNISISIHRGKDELRAKATNILGLLKKMRCTTAVRSKFI